MRHPGILLSILLLLLSLGLQAAPPGRQTLTPLEDRPPAPDFELTDLDGRVHRLSDYRGKVVIVNFWATWCPPCREEMPSMQRAWNWLQKNDMQLLAINVGENEDQVFEFTANYPVDFPLLLDEDSSVIERWPVRGLPTTFIVDTRGRLAYRAIGGRAWDSPELLIPARALQLER
ncbi:TlpA disulfide reductase family protein [Thiohalobacter sp. IOR34]|uniref:peroxiredoxin family protein n=1 Tax=Thiohalobacter sp. IOR34 TaxID=3057176 RepID=UPI0025AFDF24|nr:TlpA disulfide reductase family protein [Thiohalobacter sp. IOR34]WJW74815.1 TlpA disulfide reductase family protein [Thiohalobacter sp. IOR34]